MSGSRFESAPCRCRWCTGLREDCGQTKVRPVYPEGTLLAKPGVWGVVDVRSDGLPYWIHVTRPAVSGGFDWLLANGYVVIREGWGES